MVFASCNPPGLQLCIHCCSLHSSLHFPTGPFDPWWPCPRCLELWEDPRLNLDSLVPKILKLATAENTWVWYQKLLGVKPVKPSIHRSKTQDFIISCEPLTIWKCPTHSGSSCRPSSQPLVKWSRCCALMPPDITRASEMREWYGILAKRNGI